MKYLIIILISLISVQSLALNDKDIKVKPSAELTEAYYQKENAILQLDASRSFFKAVKSLKTTDSDLSISGIQFDEMLDKYGSECVTECIDINQFVISVTENEDEYIYVIDKSKLQCAIRNQIKCDKNDKHEKCCCYRKLKRKHKE